MKKLLSVIITSLFLFITLPCIAADMEITDFTELAATPAVGDLVPIVDINDTTDSAEGTTKKITTANLLGGVQPVEATLTDIADGTIDENLVNTANPWAVNEGGTGAATYALNGVLFGNAAAAIGVTAIGTVGQVLTVGANPFVPAWATPRDFQALPFDNGAAQATFTEANMRLYGTINNQGADEETDIILAAVSYSIKFEVEVSEDHVIELCPPSGEIFTLDGTALHANDCVNSSAVVGDCFMVKRRQIADASWQYFIYTIQGAHTDEGAAD